MEFEFGGRCYPVAAGDFVIGSGPDSALVLAGPGIRSRHAVVRLLGPGMVVVVPAEPGAEILVNGARLGSDPTPLMHGDKLQIGGFEIAVSDPRQAGATRVLAAEPGKAPAAPPAASRLISLADGREYLLNHFPFVIGRDATSDLVVESDLVSRRHAEIVAVADGEIVVDESSNGVWVNGDRIAGRVRLKSKDILRIGTAEFRYHPAERPAASAPPPDYRLGETLVGFQAIRRPPPMPEPAPPPPAALLATLLVKRGERKGDRLEIRTPVSNLGRGDFNDLVFPDASISASHAKVQLKEGIWVLTDLGSTNGTRVDGQPVRGDVPLSPGAEVTLGEVVMIFEPRDSGITKGSGTRVLEPVSATPAATALPAARSGNKGLVVLVGVGILLVVAYLLFG